MLLFLWIIFCILLGILVGYFMKKEELTLLGYFWEDKNDDSWYQAYTPSHPALRQNGKWDWPIAIYTKYETLEKKSKIKFEDQEPTERSREYEGSGYKGD